VNVFGIEAGTKLMRLAKHLSDEARATNQNVHFKLPQLALAVGSILRCIGSSHGMRSAALEAVRYQWEPCHEQHNPGNLGNASPGNQGCAASMNILVFLAEY
jgi:hypothetical protein